MRRDVRNHDLGDRDVRQLHLLAQHQRQQQVERALKDVKVKCKVREVMVVTFYGCDRMGRPRRE